MLTNTNAVRKLLSSAFTLVLVLSFSYAQAANELPQTFTLDGQLMLTGSSAALSDANAGVVIQILDPSKTCLLYEEQQTVNTTASGGYFNIQVGSATGSTKRTVNDPGRTMAQIYQNTAAIAAANAPGQTCAGLSYTPTITDSRYFRLIVTPSATGIADTLSPDTKMDSVPMSLVAQTLQGYQAGQFLMIGTGDLTQSNLQSVFSAGNASKLNSLLSVPASNYVMKDSTSGLVQLSSGTGTPAGVAAGQIWYDTGVLKYYDGATVKSLSSGGSGITDITIGSGLTPAGVISTGGQTIAVDTGTTANKIVKLDGTAKLPAVDGSALTNVIAAGLANGASIDITGPITTTGNITGQNISATGANFRTLTLTNAGAQALSIIPPAVITGTPTFTWPGSTGSSNQVLTTNGAGGILSWADASSVLGSASGDLSGTYPSPTVAKLQGVSVSATAPTTSGQVLRYNGSAWVPNFVAMTDLRSTVTGTSQFGASCTSGQTLTYNSVGDIMSCENIVVSGSNFANQNANLVLAGPTSGGAAAPSFRTLVSADLPSGVVATGTYKSVTVDTYGRVTAGTNPTTIAGYGITDAVINGGQAGSVTAGPSDANSLTLQTGGTARVSILASGDVGIGTATPGAKLDVKGAIRMSGATSGYVGFQPADVAGSTVWTLPATDGASGQVLSTNGSGDLTWATASSGSVTNVTATAPLASTGGATPNITLTRSSATVDGYLASTDFSIFNSKLSATLADGSIFVGNGSNVATAVVMSGDASLSNAGVITLTNSGVAAGSYSSVTVDAKGRVTAGAVSQDLSAVTGTLAIANGGTGQTTADAALNALLPSQTGNNGRVLQTNGSATSWVATTSGTVTSVTAAATAGNPIVMGGTAGVSPTIDIPKATATANGYLSSSDWTMFNDKLSTATVFSGDVSGTAAAISVDKIRGTNVNITAIAANNYLRYNGTDWVNANLVSTDITSSLGYVPANPTVLANYLPLAGGTMSGDLNLGGNKILNLKNVANASADPTVAEDGKTLRWNNTSGQWEWFTAGVAGAGISTLNGETGSTQSFAVNNGGTFGFTSATNVHTLNIPSSTAAVTGLLSSADFTTFNSKLTSTLADGSIFVGNGSNVATAVAMSGDASMSNAGAVTLTNSATTRGNLGLGTSAVYNVAVAGDAAAGQVVKGDDSRLTDSRAPTGAASGDLTGTYPNPTLAAVATAGTYAGAVTIDAKGRVITAAASLDLTNGVTGALPIANGGTGQITALLGFNALSPLSAKGDIITRDSTDNIRLPVGADGLVLKANSATASGLEWASATSGSVTSVTASAPLVSSGGFTPNITLARSSAAADGYLASTDWTIFNDKLSTASVFSGDVSGTSLAMSVDRIRGTNVNITAIAANNYLRYDGTDWVNSNLVSTDITSSLGYVPVNPTALSGYLSTTLADGTMLVGNGSNVATAVTMSGDASMSNAGAVTLTNSATTRGNLGLGTSAVYNVAVAGDAAAGDVVKGDDSRLTNSRAPTGAASGDLTGTYPNPTLAAVATAGTYAGAVTIDAKGRVITAAASLDLTNGVTGALPIANGGTGQITALLGFNALSPLSAKGDIITRDGTDNIRLPVGADGLVLKANSATASGLEWASATAGSVTSVTASAPLASSGGATPNITLTRSSAAADGYLASTDFTIFNDKLDSAATFSGDVTGTYNATVLANSGVTAGTYAGAVTVDAKGRVTTAAASLDLTSGVTGVLPIANGGTNASAFTNTYGVTYFDGTRLVTSAAGSANKFLVQTASGPVWTDATYPSTTTANQLLYSSAGNTVAGLATANNAVLRTDGSGVPSWSAITNDTYAQYALLAGRAGGQILYGGTAASETLKLQSTSHATKGHIILNETGGNVGIGTAAPGAKLEIYSAVGNQIKISGTTHQSGIFTNATGTLMTIGHWSTTTPRINIDNLTGNIGIGTATPGAPLDVKGEIRLSGATSGYAGFKPAAAAGSTVWTLPTADGTSGQVLTTNGSGDLSWAVATAGSVTSVAASAPLASSGGQTPTISITKADGSTDGYLASTDFTIFNNKLSTTTTFSGDISGTYDATVLASVATAGTYAGAVTIDAKGRVITAAASLDLTNGVTGALPIANGGTGQITALLGFNALSPLTAKGQIVAHDGTNNVALAAGTNGYALMADSAEASGVKWSPVMIGSGTTNKIPKFTAAGTIGDSAITDNGTTIVATRSIATTTNTVGAAAVDLALSNSHVLATPGGSAITLSNMSDGGVYNIVIADTATSRTYTFTGCANSYYKPANAPTTVGTRTVYGVMTIYNGATYDCYITWSTGFQ